MLAGLADTAASAEPLLADLDPVVPLEVRSALADARQGHRENARSDLLIASHRLTGSCAGFRGDPDVRFGVSHRGSAVPTRGEWSCPARRRIR